MAPDESTKPPSTLSQLDNVGSAVRWTLGNLEQAFEEALEQAVDEAFRTCNTIHSAIRDELGGAATHDTPAADQPIRIEAARFKSCEGPIADGEPGEGLGDRGG